MTRPTLTLTPCELAKISLLRVINSVERQEPITVPLRRLQYALSRLTADERTALYSSFAPDLVDIINQQYLRETLSMLSKEEL